MAVRYRQLDGKPVSVAWHRVLTRAREKGVSFSVTSGHRTMAEQRALFDQNMQFVGGRWVPKPGRPLTAWPSPTAPHIREGRPDHAIDFGPDPQAVLRLMGYLNRRGRRLGGRLTVPGEWWHVEVKAWRLVDLARRILAPLRKGR